MAAAALDEAGKKQGSRKVNLRMVATNVSSAITPL